MKTGRQIWTDYAKNNPDMYEIKGDQTRLITFKTDDFERLVDAHILNNTNNLATKVKIVVDEYSSEMFTQLKFNL